LRTFVDGARARAARAILDCIDRAAAQSGPEAAALS
jgi:hypothetical protein